MYMTKPEAIEILQYVAESNIIDKEITDKIEEIAFILQNEIESGLNLWGAGDDVNELFVSVRSDLLTDEYTEKMKKLWDKYSKG